MMPAASELWIYSSIAAHSGREILYRRLWGNVDPGSRSMAQSRGRCGGRERACCLQNTSEFHDTPWGSATGPAELVRAPGARQRGTEQIADNWHERRGSSY